ncbi:hypothetical protein AgCh_016093 [Apium graveolens]
MTWDILVDFRAFVAKQDNLQGVELTMNDVGNYLLFPASDEVRKVLEKNTWKTRLNGKEKEEVKVLSSEPERPHCQSVRPRPNIRNPARLR